MAAWLPILPAQAITPPFFNAMYWLKGNVTVDQSQEQAHPIILALSNRQVIIYKDVFPGPYVGGQLHAITINMPPPSKVKGDYMMNIIAEKKLPIVAGQQYKVAVVQGKDGYGMNPVDVTITDVGYITKDLVIKYGEGPAFPYGTVPLNIERSGSNIKVSWDITVFEYQNPKLFMLTGDGTGKYTNDAGWATINDKLGLGFPFEGSDLAGGYIIHKNQVGQGFGEVYFKGIQNTFPNEMDINPNVPGNISYLASAWAVGKVNVTVEKSGQMKLLGLPVSAGKVSNVFLGQLGANEVILLPSTVGGGGLDYVTVNNTNVTGNDFLVGPAVGFWLRNPGSSDLTITFAGSLANTAFTKNLLAFDLSGNPFPLSVASGGFGVDGDIIMPQMQTGNGLDYFVKTAGNWGPNFPALKFDAGFWYKYAANNRRWNVVPFSDAKIEQYKN
ncbi:MAG: hypothetical protein WC903_00460 [Candidatus Margulisiibacteriota bacterium]